jgi:single-strand DNA-binding protein
MRYTAGGTAYCRFSLAVTERYKGETKTIWLNLIAWGKLAEICTKYLTKGSKIGIRGKFSQSTYTKDGVKKTNTEILIEELEFLNEKGDKERTSEPSPPPDDLPFF